MAPPSIPAELVAKIAELRRAGQSIRQIAKQVKLPYVTVNRYVMQYVPRGAKGEPPPPRPMDQVVDRTDVDGSVELMKMDRPATVEEMMALCKLDPCRWIPQYFSPNSWQGFARVKMKDGEELRKVQLYQSKLVCKRVIAEEVEAAILEFVRKHVGPLPPRSRRREAAPEEQMVAWGLWDAHLGMYAWNSEVGTDFDVGIARTRVLNSVDDMVAELKPYKIGRIVMPVGNDFLHFDSVRHKTAFGEHFLDTDTRFGKVYMTGLECLEYMVERALELCGQVDVLYIPGNHDTTSSFTLCAALSRRYLKDSRVRVDLSANPRKYVTHGGTLLGFDHGDGAKAQQLALVFATEAREHWSGSTYREIQVGHTHQRAEAKFPSVAPANGVVVRVNPALCNNDLWHHKQALVGEPVKSVEAWRYDRVGYRGSHVAWARDEARKEKR